MLNVDDYVKWATNQIGGNMNMAATLSNGALADIKTTTGFWARFFGVGDFASQRTAVRDDFRRALTERFGSLVATAMMRDVGPDLTAAVIMKTVSTAKIYAMRSALTPRNDRCFKLTDGDLVLTQATINGMSRAGRQALDGFLRTTNAVSKALGTIPTGDREYAAFQRNIDELKQRILATKTALLQEFADDPQGLGEDGFRNFMATCDAQYRCLEDHFLHVTDLHENGATSQAAKDRYRTTWHEAFMQACDLLLQHLPDQGDPAVSTALRNLRQTPEDAFKAQFDSPKDLKENIAKFIEKSLKTACGNNPFGKDVVKNVLAKAYEQVLNARPWTPIDKTFTGALAGQTFTLKSTITPGKHVAGVGETYPPGVNGYMCHSASESQHAVNIAVSTLKVQGPDNNETTVFTGVRHGVHCAWEIADPAEREQANKNRATEAVKAAFSSYLANHPGLSEDNPITLPMTSVSLLTPDLFRSLGLSKTSRNERKMLLEQTAAWNAVNNRQMEITVNGRTFRVTPRIATFNFSVNWGGIGSLSGIFGGWGVSRPMNRQAFEIVHQRVVEFRNDPTVPPEKKLVAKTLLKQVADILNKEQESTDGHDAYKAAYRLAVLTNLMDGVPCWNCKSGKDRTGEMDVECKFLATLIARGMDIPEPGAELTPEQKALFRTIALEGGNHEMQEYNTGIAGFKTDGVDSIPERLGGDEARTVHQGGAEFVSA